MNVLGSVKKFSLGGMFIGAMVLASSLSFTGCLTDDDDKKPADTTTHTPFGAKTTLTAAAQGHLTMGSVLEFDAGKVLTSQQANAAQATIDGVVLYYSGAWHLENAVMARASGVTHSINLTNSYNVNQIQDIPYVKVATMPVDQEAAEKAFDDGTPIKGSVIKNGDIFIINTTEGNMAVVEVKTLTGTDDGVGEFSFTLLTL